MGPLPDLDRFEAVRDSHSTTSRDAAGNECTVVAKLVRRINLDLMCAHGQLFAQGGSQTLTPQ
jgi:hypothetical protein